MNLRDISQRLRVRILERCYAAGGGHLGGAYSVLDVLVAIYFSDFLRPNDKVIYSKGHSSLALYAVLTERGLISESDWESYCRNGGALGGHPKRGISGVELSTGSLGHGLSVAAGMAYTAKLDKSDARFICICGDGEMNEGSVWEAVMFASQHRLNNLMLIVDNNGMESLDRTDSIMSIEPLWCRLHLFNWFAEENDGHDIEQIVDAINYWDRSRPRAIIAHTIKGKGVSFMENTAKWHYRCPIPEERDAALKELGGSVRETSAT